VDLVGDLKIILYGPLISFNRTINIEYEFHGLAAAAAVANENFRSKLIGSRIFKHGPMEVLHEN